MSTNNNYSYLSPVGPWPLLTNSLDTVNPGVALGWDSGTKTYRPITVGSNGRYFAGVALGSNQLTGIDNDQITQNLFVPAALDGLHSFKATNGETLNPGDPLYFSTTAGDALTVVKAAPANATTADIIGFYWPDDSASITIADAVTKVKVLIQRNFPSVKLG